MNTPKRVEMKARKRRQSRAWRLCVLHGGGESLIRRKCDGMRVDEIVL